MTKEQFIILLGKYERQQLTAMELEQFLEAAGDPAMEELLTDRLAQTLQETDTKADAGGERERKVWDAISEQVNETTSVSPSPVRRMQPWKWVAAAAVLSGVMLLGYQYFKPTNIIKPAPVAMKQPAADIQPGKTGAVLVLADGSEISLDSAANGEIATQGNSHITLQNGRLSYSQGQHATTVFNDLRIPKGRQFHLTLPDGTDVWLNAGSSLRYPASFSGKERKVEVHGEAYFEVAANPSMPFRVNVNNKALIEVLGTQFNVNDYDNENNISTTLLKGSVKVTLKDKQVLLKPGQQAQITNQSPDQINVSNHADLEKVMAWKNGLFNFEGASLEEVMRQLERWYDIEVVYEKGVPSVEFSGEMTKSMSLNGVLLALEKSDIHFRLEGRKLIVLP